MRKFLDGLFFGAGFAISFLVIWVVASYWISPLLVTSSLERINKRHPAMSGQYPGLSGDAVPSKPSKPFYELGVDGQIQQSSVIALAKYERASNGEMKAVIKEFLKKDPKATVYYSIGDEFSPSSHYPKDGTDRGDGVIVFFTGSPAEMAMSMTFSGGRISSLGDIPIELFRDKCREPGA